MTLPKINSITFEDHQENTMSSREIAELTGKRHDHVLRDCDTLNENYTKLPLPKLEEGYYTHPNTGKQQHREYLLTKMQTFDLLTGYSTELRIKINRRWEELEKKNKLPAPTRKQLAQWVIDLEEQNEKAQRKINSLTPKAMLMDRVMDSETLIDVGQAAKILKLPFGRNTLFRKLREKGIFFKDRNEPLQYYIDRKYFEVKQKLIPINGKATLKLKTLPTQRGLKFIAEEFGVIPTQQQLALFE